MTSLVTGPHLLTATIASTFAMGYTFAMRERYRYVPMVTSCAALLAAWILEQTGAVTTPMPALPDSRVSLLVLLTEFVIIITTSRFSIIIVDKLRELQRRDHLQAWQLRQLLPKQAATSSAVPAQ